MKPKSSRPTARNASTSAKREADALLEKLGYAELKVAAALSGVTPKTWRNRAAAGDTPAAYKLGRKTVYRIDDLAAYIARRRVDRVAA
jgi:helix-turn-helix protein